MSVQPHIAYKTYNTQVCKNMTQDEGQAWEQIFESKMKIPETQYSGMEALCFVVFFF